MDDVFGGLEQPEPGDFQGLDQTQDALGGDVPEYATITVDGAGPDGLMLRCGDSISGNIAWSTDQTVRSVRLRLECWSEGRGTKNTLTAGALDLEGAPNGSRPFEFRVPGNGPTTYFGDMITLQWKLELTLDVPRRRDESTEIPVIVGPARA